jgi:hypothetical protein
MVDETGPLGEPKGASRIQARDERRSTKAVLASPKNPRTPSPRANQVSLESELGTHGETGGETLGEIKTVACLHLVPDD